MAIKIYNENNIHLLQDLKKNQNINKKQKANKSGPMDRVDFSSELQQANRTKELSASKDIQRTQRIEQLKEQIANGTYKPDLQEVAAHMLQFLAKGK